MMLREDFFVGRSWLDWFMIWFRAFRRGFWVFVRTRKTAIASNATAPGSHCVRRMRPDIVAPLRCMRKGHLKNDCGPHKFMPRQKPSSFGIRILPLPVIILVISFSKKEGKRTYWECNLADWPQKESREGIGLNFAENLFLVPPA